MFLPAYDSFCSAGITPPLSCHRHVGQQVRLFGRVHRGLHTTIDSSWLPQSMLQWFFMLQLRRTHPVAARVYKLTHPDDLAQLLHPHLGGH